MLPLEVIWSRLHGFLASRVRFKWLSELSSGTPGIENYSEECLLETLLVLGSNLVNEDLRVLLSRRG